MNVRADLQILSPKDYASSQEIRWCPGCGDFAIIKAVQKALAEEQVPTEKVTFVSGIGCSSRFPYYMETYGFHTIHGRAPSVATGLKLSNPELDVWVVTGDGDGLSIGGNHMIHTLRRNLNLQILLFNNEVYGLTKGQCSPTSQVGIRTPSTPAGSIDNPLSPCALAMGAGGRFIARALDKNQAELIASLRRARHFIGTAFVEILQNCIIFNDGAFDAYTDKATAADRCLVAEHGKPLLFGKTLDKGLRFNAQTMAIEVVAVGEGGIPVDEVLIHDERNPVLANMLLSLTSPQFPLVLGVIYANPAEAYEQRVYDQLSGDGAEPEKTDLKAELDAIYRSGAIWTVR